MYIVFFLLIVRCIGHHHMIICEEEHFILFSEVRNGDLIPGNIGHGQHSGRTDERQQAQEQAGGL